MIFQWVKGTHPQKRRLHLGDLPVQKVSIKTIMDFMTRNTNDINRLSDGALNIKCSRALMKEWIKYFLARDGKISTQDLYNIQLDLGEGFSGQGTTIRSYLKLTPLEYLWLDLNLGAIDSLTSVGLAIESGDFDVQGQDDC